MLWFCGWQFPSIVQTVYHFGRVLNILITIAWIGMKFSKDIHIPQRMNPTSIWSSSFYCLLLMYWMDCQKIGTGKIFFLKNVVTLDELHLHLAKIRSQCKLVIF